MIVASLLLSTSSGPIPTLGGLFPEESVSSVRKRSQTPLRTRSHGDHESYVRPVQKRVGP